MLQGGDGKTNALHLPCATPPTPHLGSIDRCISQITRSRDEETLGEGGRLTHWVLFILRDPGTVRFGRESTVPQVFEDRCYSHCVMWAWVVSPEFLPRIKLNTVQKYVSSFKILVHSGSAIC